MCRKFLHFLLRKSKVSFLKINNFFRFLNLRISGYSPAITVVMPRKIFYACNKGSMWTTYPIFSLFSLFLPAKSFKLLKKTFSPLKGGNLKNWSTPNPRFLNFHSGVGNMAPSYHSIVDGSCIRMRDVDYWHLVQSRWVPTHLPSWSLWRVLVGICVDDYSRWVIIFL